jgi:hypothetical protein
MTKKTAESPSTEPKTGPAIQVELRGGDELVAGVDSADAMPVPVDLADCEAEPEGLHAVAGQLLVRSELRAGDFLPADALPSVAHEDTAVPV